MDKEKEELLKEYVKILTELGDLRKEYSGAQNSTAEKREELLMKITIKRIGLRKLEKQLYGEMGE